LKLRLILNAFGLEIFWGMPLLKLGDFRYSSLQISDDVASFHGDQPMELGDLVERKLKKNISSEF